MLAPRLKANGRAFAHIAQYLPDLTGKTTESGTVMVRLVIARDGRLLESGIATSSGIPALDNGMLVAIRAGAPYPPLPADFPGHQFVLTQPINATRNGGTR